MGENGEIIFSHISGGDIDALSYCTRPQKGEGEWEENVFYGPPGHEQLIWPRMVTGGQNNNIIYLIAVTAPVPNGGAIYQGIDGALLYSRSIDGGLTWLQQNILFPELDSLYYKAIMGDCYAWAEPKDSIVAFIAGSCNHDLFLMKSSDYGETFEKTIIWDHPFDNGYQVIPEDTFYCTDGSIAAAIDFQGKVHVSFGISKAYHEELYSYDILWRDVDGLGYWNEDLPAFSTNLNALNPYGHPESELVVDETLIGWGQDINGNGYIEILDEWGNYIDHGMSTMPQIVIDDLNRIIVVYTSVTETFDNGTQSYRRLWIRSSLDGGNSWGQFYLYGSVDPFYIFTEFSYPSCAADSDDNIYILFQWDNEPGLNMYGGGDMYYNENFFSFTKIPKDEIVGIKKNEQPNQLFEVSQNFPNPFSKTTTIKVNLLKSSDLRLKVTGLLGQQVYETEMINAKPGINTLVISAEGLSSGIYFYTVNANETYITKKMIVD